MHIKWMYHEIPLVRTPLIRKIALFTFYFYIYTK